MNIKITAEDISEVKGRIEGRCVDGWDAIIEDVAGDILERELQGSFGVEDILEVSRLLWNHV